MTILYLAFVLISFTFANSEKEGYVTCHSAVKMINQEYHVKLFTSEMKYQSGSGQQAVTGYDSNAPDSNAYWIFRGTADKPCSWGHPLRCGSTVRIMHMMTNRNLHSHHVSSPLSGIYNEVSAYGESGEGDSGDEWKLQCVNSESEFWRRSDAVELRHVETGEFLAASDHSFSDPVRGYREIVGASRGRNKATLWLPGEGVYIHPKSAREIRVSKASHHSEL